MSRNLKVLGLMVAAVFALSGTMASNAFAFTQFMSEGNVNTAVTADQEEGNNLVFTVEGSTFKCTTAHFETTTEEALPSLPPHSSRATAAAPRSASPA
jgi:hypothetical protein